MQILFAFEALVAIALLCWAAIEGFENVLETIALWLKRLAKGRREMRERRRRDLNQEWVRELEMNPEGTR